MNALVVLADSASTNLVPITYAPVTDVDGVINMLNSLYGMPGHILVGLTCIIFGYVLRFIPRFPNGGIPLACVLWGMVFNPLLAEASTVSPRVWYVRNILIGAVIGAGAWAIHRWIFKRMEASIPILGDALNAADEASDEKAFDKVDAKVEAALEAEKSAQLITTATRN